MAGVQGDHWDSDTHGVKFWKRGVECGEPMDEGWPMPAPPHATPLSSTPHAALCHHCSTDKDHILLRRRWLPHTANLLHPYHMPVYSSTSSILSQDS